MSGQSPPMSRLQSRIRCLVIAFEKALQPRSCFSVADFITIWRETVLLFVACAGMVYVPAARPHRWSVSGAPGLVRGTRISWNFIHLTQTMSSG